MSGFDHAAKLQAALLDSQVIRRKAAIVTSYDPDAYRAKVKLQPEDLLTGWLPIASAWVGAGWGFFTPPAIGQLVRVEFVEGHLDAGEIVGSAHNSALPPVSVPAGEMLLQHAAGSLLQFHNDSTVKLISAGTLTTQAPQWNHTGPVFVDGSLQTSGDITDNNTTNSSTLAQLRTAHNDHDHPDPQGGSTGTPNLTV